MLRKPVAARRETPVRPQSKRNRQPRPQWVADICEMADRSLAKGGRRLSIEEINRELAQIRGR